MTTNIHYLIAGMAVLLVVIWQYSRQRQMDDRNSRMFRRLLSVVSLDVAAELVSTGFILYAPYSFNVCRMLSNTVFYLFQALLPLLLLYYVCTLCTSRVIAPSAVLRMGIPTIALVCIILTNPFTEMLFYFDGTGYRHGPWYLLLYVSALLHIAGAAVFVAVHRASVSRRNLASLFAVFALAALGIAAQAVNPEVLTTGFGLSLSILAMYLTINNPCACMDSLTGLNDKQYLLRRMDELTDAHKAFHIITVYAYQLEHMNKIAGMRGGDEFLRRAAERMQEIAGRNVFRVTGRRFLLLTFSLREYETCLTRLRQLFHTQPDDAQSAPTPVILCGVVNAEKLGTSGLVLDYAEYLESLVSQSGETQVIQNDRKTMDSFHYNKQVEQFLHRAIEEDLFEVYYQPVYSLHRQRYVTLEALSRLRHPELGWISPDIFIRLAEKNHLITQITELQLRRVCRFLRENPALRASIANVKINLSPLDLIQSESGSHLVPGAVIVGGVLRVVCVVRIEVFQHAVGVLIERPGAVCGLRPFIVRAAEVGALGVVRRQLAVEHLREGLRELIAALASDLAVRPREQHGRGIDDAERQSDEDGDRAERDDERNAAPPSAPQRVPALPYPVHVCRLLCVMKIRVRQRRTLHSACSCCLR